MTLENENSMLILDGGSGLMVLDAELREKYPDYPLNLPFRPNLILSHLHLDHILGLSGFAPLWVKGSGARIFTNSRSEDLTLEQQIFGIYQPPYWPVHMSQITAAECIEITDTFEADGFTVTPFEAEHSDLTVCFFVTDGEKTVVHLLDYEMPETGPPPILMEYCKNADMILFDSAYAPDHYESKRGWGHSTVRHGLKLANDSKCKRMIFAHYGQEYSDEDIDEMKKLLPEGDERFLFAYEGMDIEV